MNKNFNLELPINSLSFGQVGFGVLMELFNRRYMPNIFPIGQIDLSSFNVDQSFHSWLGFCLKKAKAQYSRQFTTIRLWHIFDSERRISDKQVLWTAHETDMFTPVEKNIISNTDTVLFTSSYAANTAREAGLKNVDVCPNYFDSFHFSNLKKQSTEDCISFSLIGKYEKRKHTEKILKLWIKNFGNNPKFRLNCLISNPFFNENQFGEILSQAFPQGLPWNVNLIPRLQRNSDVGAVMASSDIDLSGLSGAEGFNLPCFNMLALNKICVVLNAHSHKDFADSESCFLVEPSGKEPIYDNMFFVKGEIANQGNMYSFNDEDAIEAINNAINFYINGKSFNSSLSERFSVNNTVDKLLSFI
jgi:hypothetical protein